MDISEILKEAILHKSSDLFIIPGATIQVKSEGKLKPLFEKKIMPSDSSMWIDHIYKIADRDKETLKKSGDDDFSFAIPSLGRFRCNAYKQRGSFACVVRVVPFGLPDPKHMEILPSILELANTKNGMVLVTGPAGSGKSTTLACLIDRINENKGGHIITLEDPIEFIHSHKRSLISQREISLDTKDYAAALRAALRQTPNVILLGEMRDFETIQTAISAAETGQLLLSSLHTLGAAKTIDRIIDAFPPNQQSQIRVQLSMVLKAVVSQQLIPGEDGKLHPAFEIMIVTPAIANLIREGKIFQINNVIHTSKEQGMISMDDSIAELVRNKIVSKEKALGFVQDPIAFQRKVR